MRTGLVVLGVCAMTSTVLASGGPPADVPGLAKGAEKVVVASVLQVNARFGTNEFGDRLIVSEASLRVEETLKGAHAASASVIVEGGTVGDLTLEVSDMPQLESGDRAVMFLRGTSGGNVPHGRGVGIMKLNEDDRVENSDLTLDEIKQLVRGTR